MYHKGAIEGYPLQTYASALLCSLTGSLIRQLFQHEEPEAISISPALSDGWSACLQTLEGHSGWVSSVAFSRDSTRLTSASYDNTVKTWDASSGACLQTLEGHSGWFSSVAFSHDSARLASASGDHTVKIWDASSGVYAFRGSRAITILRTQCALIASNILIKVSALAQIESGLLTILKSCCGSQRSIDQNAQLCKADVLA
jgi:WD40 repeat protein